MNNFIKDIVPAQTSIQILFEVIKIIEQNNHYLICRISDSTGTSLAYFQNPIKKYIQENKVYSTRNAVACVVDNHLRIQIDKLTGSITKQPTILKFKDNSYDISAQQITNTTNLNGKVQKQQSIEQYIEKSEENMDSSINEEILYQEKGAQNLQQEKEQHILLNDIQVEKNIKYKKQEKNEKLQDHRFIKLKQLLSQCITDESVNVIAQVSDIQVIGKKDRQFLQCDLSDETGTVLGSFFINTKRRINEEGYYKFMDMKYQINKRGVIILLQTRNTFIEVYKNSFEINPQKILKKIQKQKQKI